MNLDLAAELVAMADADQAAAQATIGPDGRYLPAGHPSLVAEQRLRQSHALRLRQIMHEHGWPTISMVGADAAQCAWLLAQHSDHDLALQRQALTAMQAAADDVSAIDLAYLTDRVAVADGHPQHYGTQLYSRNGELVPQPVADPETLDARRAAIGLLPLQQYLDLARNLPHPPASDES